MSFFVKKNFVSKPQSILENEGKSLFQIDRKTDKSSKWTNSFSKVHSQNYCENSKITNFDFKKSSFVKGSASPRNTNFNLLSLYKKVDLCSPHPKKIVNKKQSHLKLFNQESDIKSYETSIKTTDLEQLFINEELLYEFLVKTQEESDIYNIFQRYWNETSTFDFQSILVILKELY